MTSNSKDLAERLRAAIVAKGMRHAWVAAEAGLTQASLSNILTGRTSKPSLSSVAAIAHAIGEPLGALLGERSQTLLESEEDVLRRAIEILENRVLQSRSMRAAASPSEDPDEAEAIARHVIPAAIHRLGARLAFRATGAALADEGIRDGDILYVKPTADTRAVSGRIVICRASGSLMIGRLRIAGTKIRLERGNDHLTVSDAPFELVGMVVAHLGEI